VRAAAITTVSNFSLTSPQLYKPDLQRLLKFLHDAHPVVRLRAVESIGKLCRKQFFPDELESVVEPFKGLLTKAILEHNASYRVAVGPILNHIRSNADQDATIRHAAVHALVRIGDADALLAAAKDSSASVRLGVCLALRRLMHPGIAQFLDDPDPRIVLEAARAIADLPIEPALPKLADLAEKYFLEPELQMSAPLLRRIANANFRVGGTTNAESLSMLASTRKAPESIRLEAIEMLGEWATPSNRDKVTGLWRPLAPRKDKYAAAAALFCIATKPTDYELPSLQAAATRAARALDWKLPYADEAFANTNLQAEVRLEFLRAMQDQKHPKFEATLALAAKDVSETVRKEASRLSAASGGTDAIARLATTLQTCNRSRASKARRPTTRCARRSRSCSKASCRGNCTSMSSKPPPSAVHLPSRSASRSLRRSAMRKPRWPSGASASPVATPRQAKSFSTSGRKPPAPAATSSPAKVAMLAQTSPASSPRRVATTCWRASFCRTASSRRASSPCWS
jgi:hypothetical protein